ncbi:hypothetical protein AX15_007336 [Amanita polypyramis BW_CC]|nr:hypothetical protein AX15_007336 [Amanita polypyramis BW_CC]
MLVQILSLIPDPKEEPYFRRFLQTSQSCGIPNLITKAFIHGIGWKRPGHICFLLIHCLLWCDSDQGDDGKACIDAQLQARLHWYLVLLISDVAFTKLDGTEQTDMQRLFTMLGVVKHMHEDCYIKSTRAEMERELYHHPLCQLKMPRGDEYGLQEVQVGEVLRKDVPNLALEEWSSTEVLPTCIGLTLICHIPTHDSESTYQILSTQAAMGNIVVCSSVKVLSAIFSTMDPRPYTNQATSERSNWQPG